MNNPVKTVEILGIPSDLGANIRGSNMGPAAIRIAHLHKKIKELGYGVIDDGDILVPVRETIQEIYKDEKYKTVIQNICEQTHDRVYKTLENGNVALTIGGDHSVAMGSILGVNNYFNDNNKTLGLVWFDAHADLNTPETSPTGNIHGMPLATIIGKGFPSLTNIADNKPLDPKNIALIGIRSIDGNEKKLCRESGIRYFTMREIDEKGMPQIMKEAIEVASGGTDGIHVSFDLDGIDPLYAPGVSTPVTGGISYRESHLALELLADTQKVVSMDFVELNPMTDISHQTANLTVELIQSLLGKGII